MEARQDIGADRRVDVAQMGLGIGVIDGSCDVKLVHSMQTMFSEPHSGQVSFPVTVRGMRSSPQSLQPCTLGSLVSPLVSVFGLLYSFWPFYEMVC
jgi:hypothetical protein